MADVFISYAKTDRTHAERLAARLSAEGWTVWWDPHIAPGDDFDEVILDELAAARCVLVLWSERSCKSRYVKGEARFAMRQGKLVPAFIEKKVTPPLDFHSIQAVFLHDWDGDPGDLEYQKLVRRVARQVEEAGPGEEAPQEPPPVEVTAPPANKPRPPARPRSPSRAPGTVYRDSLKSGGEGPEMVIIPPGFFMMGSPEGEEGRDDSEGPQHEVTLSQPFALGRFPVTFDEYDRFIRATSGLSRWWKKLKNLGRGRRPVVNVSWKDAVAYCEWLSHETGKPYRLPSEAEWEYACRAGTKTAYWWGDEPGNNRANFSGSGSQWDGRKTSPVGSFEPNPFGLYDMLGNVWEWGEDAWHPDYNGAPSDGSAWTAGGAGADRVFRGGSWDYDAWYCRSAYRGRIQPDGRNGGLGFRCARVQV